MEVLLQIIRCEKMDGQKINKRGGSNKGMADGFFCKINRGGATYIR